MAIASLMPNNFTTSTRYVFMILAIAAAFMLLAPNDIGILFGKLAMSILTGWLMWSLFPAINSWRLMKRLRFGRWATSGAFCLVIAYCAVGAVDELRWFIRYLINYLVAWTDPSQRAPSSSWYIRKAVDAALLMIPSALIAVPPVYHALRKSFTEETDTAALKTLQYSILVGLFFYGSALFIRILTRVNDLSTMSLFNAVSFTPALLLTGLTGFSIMRAAMMLPGWSTIDATTSLYRSIAALRVTWLIFAVVAGLSLLLNIAGAVGNQLASAAIVVIPMALVWRHALSYDKIALSSSQKWLLLSFIVTILVALIILTGWMAYTLTSFLVTTEAVAFILMPAVAGIYLLLLLVVWKAVRILLARMA